MLEGGRTRAIVVTTLALAVGVVAASMSGSASLVAEGVTADQALLVEPASDATRVLFPAEVVQGRASASALVRAAVVQDRAEESSDASSEQRYGSIEGVVHDARGYPQMGQLWVFRHAQAGVRERRVRSTMNGNIELREVESGSWQALFGHVHPAVQVPMLTVMGEVQVSADEVAWIELAAPGGTRSLYGEYVLRVEGASHEVVGGERVTQTMEQDLDLELWPLDAGQGAFSSGRARVVSFPGGSRREASVDEVPEDDGRPPLRKGAFYFGGLEPGRYLLRIVPTGNQSVKATYEDGEVREIELGIERAIDLVPGDVVLEPETFSMVDDFVLPALERAAKH